MTPHHSCGSSCEGCSLRPPEQDDGGERIVGGRLVAASALVFLLPLSSAVLGAHQSGPSGLAQLTGVLLGLLAGVVLARVGLFVFRINREPVT